MTTPLKEMLEQYRDDIRRELVKSHKDKSEDSLYVKFAFLMSESDRAHAEAKTWKAITETSDARSVKGYIDETALKTVFPFSGQIVLYSNPTHCYGRAIPITTLPHPGEE